MRNSPQAFQREKYPKVFQSPPTKPSCISKTNDQGSSERDEEYQLIDAKKISSFETYYNNYPKEYE